jgi:hypothetical protein
VIPSGGKTLELMRLKGKRPPGFVVITESSKIASHYRNPLRSIFVLRIEPGKSYDWRVVHGLDVLVDTELDRSTVAPMCQALLEVGPKSFRVHYHGRHETECDKIL